MTFRVGGSDERTRLETMLTVAAELPEAVLCLDGLASGFTGLSCVE